MGALRGMVKGGEVTSTTMSTYQMSEEQKRDQTIDYISGFEIIDDQRRLFVLEGLTHSGMTQMELIIKKDKFNDHLYKYIMNRDITFRERLYTEF